MMSKLSARFETLARRWRERRAIAAVEFALVAPLMLLFAAGVTETGALLRAYSTTNRLTMQYALAYADCQDIPSGTCNTELGYYTSASALSNVVPELVQSNLTLRMFQVSMTGATPTVIYAYPSGATPNTAETAAAVATIPSGQYGVIVSTTYLHTLKFFGSVMSPIFSPFLTVSYVEAQLANGSTSDN